MTNRDEQFTPSARFRKKPVVIDAIQWDGTLEHAKQIDAWSGGKVFPVVDRGRGCDVWDGKLNCTTLEGLLGASPLDYIIRGVKGEYYACKPEIFQMTYEPADSPVSETATNATHQPGTTHTANAKRPAIAETAGTAACAAPTETVTSKDDKDWPTPRSDAHFDAELGVHCKTFHWYEFAKKLEREIASLKACGAGSSR